MPASTPGSAAKSAQYKTVAAGSAAKPPAQKGTFGYITVSIEGDKLDLNGAHSGLIQAQVDVVFSNGTKASWPLILQQGPGYPVYSSVIADFKGGSSVTVSGRYEPGGGAPVQDYKREIFNHDGAVTFFE